MARETFRGLREPTQGQPWTIHIGAGQQVDDRPPICPACGVTMGITLDEKARPGYVCLECGFADEPSTREST